MSGAVFTEHPQHGILFEGFEPRECGEHHTVGSYRAWCFDDTEWCYPSTPCRGCEITSLREKITEAHTAIEAMVLHHATAHDTCKGTG
jgi:hypothetical protein